MLALKREMKAASESLEEIELLRDENSPIILSTWGLFCEVKPNEISVLRKMSSVRLSKSTKRDFPELMKDLFMSTIKRATADSLTVMREYCKLKYKTRQWLINVYKLIRMQE